MGILTPKFMRKYRRHAIVVIFIVSAVVTPTPDMVTQTLLGSADDLLYEVSISSQSIHKKRQRLPLRMPNEYIPPIREFTR